MKKIVLGFDCSSSVIGWSALEIDLISKEINEIKSGYHKVIKKGSLMDRIVHTRDVVNNILNQIKPDYIGIEQIIEFMQGKSTAKTIIMLTTFNRMIALCAYDFLKKSPEFFNVMSIRHGLKLNKQLPKKEEMPDLIAHHLGTKFLYEKNRKGNIKTENYDMADGMAVALYYAFILTNKKKAKK